MSKHSPGPWRALDFEGIADALGRTVAETHGGALPPSARAADARLIAAAPEMLDLLRRIVGGGSRLDPECKWNDGKPCYNCEGHSLIARIEGNL